MVSEVKGEALADELVDDGGDTTLWMHKNTEMEDAFAKDGSSPDPRVPGADQGSEHQVADAAAGIGKAATPTVFEERNHPPNSHGG